MRRTLHLNNSCFKTKDLTLKTEPKSAAFSRPDASTLIAARAKTLGIMPISENLGKKKIGGDYCQH
jgi:hypothetical protein